MINCALKKLFDDVLRNVKFIIYKNEFNTKVRDSFQMTHLPVSNSDVSTTNNKVSPLLTGNLPGQQSVEPVVLVSGSMDSNPLKYEKKEDKENTGIKET